MPLSARITGYVIKVNVDDNQYVDAGTALAEIDPRDYQVALDQASASLADAQATAQALNINVPIASVNSDSQVSSTEADVENARAGISVAQDQFSAAKSQLDQAQANDVKAQNDLIRYKQLVDKQEISQQQYDQAVAAAKANSAAVASAHASATAAEQQVTQARSRLAQAEANVQLLQTQIAQCSIYAPFDGVVTQRLLDPGAFAGPNQPIVRVSELDSVYVNANVPDENLSFVHAGTPITFTSASLPGKTFSGKIMDVNAIPTAGTLSYRARVRVPNPGDTLRGGMLVSVQIRRGYRQNVVVVPRTAIFQTDQGANVYTVVDGKAKLLPVKVGLQTDTLSEVVGNAVSAGTLVITTRPDALQNGSVVAVGGASPPPGPGASGSPKKKGQ